MASVSRNQRLAWIASQVGEGKSNASIVMECMTLFPGVSEAVARKDLKEIMQRLTEIELANLPEIKTRFLEIGWKLLEECRKYSQMGAAVNQFKNLALMAGVLDDKKPENNQQANGAPDNKIIRERIAQLMRNKKIKAQAEEAGIDLESIAGPGKDE